MKLSVLERIMMMNVLPNEGTFTNLKLIRIAREVISFTEEENKILDFKQEGKQLNWSNSIIDGKMIDAIPEKDIKFGEVVTNLLIENLKLLNEQGKLTQQHFSLYEKFIT